MRMHTFEKKSTALVNELKFSDCHDDFFFQKHSMILKKKRVWFTSIDDYKCEKNTSAHSVNRKEKQL